MSSIKEYWDGFLSATHQNADEVDYAGEIGFEGYGVQGTELINLVLDETKTASFSAYESFTINMEPVPVAGELYIVEDNNDEPVCVIELTDVQVLPFKEVTWEMARKEGEDADLESWRDKQKEYMSDEAAVCGFEFNEDSPVVFEAFHVIYRKLR